MDEALLDQARQEAARRGESLTALIDLGLRLVIAQTQPSRRPRKIDLPVSRHKGGVLPGVDLNSGAALADLLDGAK